MGNRRQIWRSNCNTQWNNMQLYSRISVGYWQQTVPFLKIDYVNIPLTGKNILTYISATEFMNAGTSIRLPSGKQNLLPSPSSGQLCSSITPDSATEHYSERINTSPMICALYQFPLLCFAMQAWPSTGQTIVLSLLSWCSCISSVFSGNVKSTWLPA